MELMGNNSSNNYLVKSFSLLLIIISMVLGSCVPKSKTIDPLTKSEYSKINNIAVVISANEEFTVMVERVKQSGYWGSSCSSAEGCVFELIAIVIIAVVDSYLDHRSDKKDAEMIQEKLEQFDATEKLSTKLRHNLKSSNTRFNVEIAETNFPGTLKANGFDSILEVNLIEWGFELCRKYPSNPEYSDYYKLLEEWRIYERKIKGTKFLLYSSNPSHRISMEEQENIDRLRPLVERYNADDKVKSQIKASAKIVELGDNEIVWERLEVYKGKKCEWLGDIKDNPAILYDILSNAINNLAINTVNEIK